MSIGERSRLSHHLYEWVTDEDAEGSACEDILEEACQKVPRSFLLNFSNGAATKLAEQFASPDLVLVWLLGVLGAPVFFSGMLEPVRRGAAMFPQLAISGRMRAYAKRKWFWVGAGITQASALLIMLVAALTLTGGLAGAVVVGTLLVFSAASGVGSSIQVCNRQDHAQRQARFNSWGSDPLLGVFSP